MEEQLCKLEETVSQWPGGMTDNCIVHELLVAIRELQAQIAPPEPPPHNCSGCAHWHSDRTNMMVDVRLCEQQTHDGMRYVMTHKECTCPLWSVRNG